MTRLTVEDTVQTTIAKLADSIPGATLACVSIMAECNGIDKDAPDSGWVKLMYLDDWGIYGPAINVLYKDICKSETPRMIALLRAVQLGILPKETLQVASVRGSGVKIDTDDIWKKVCEVLPNFQKQKEKTK